LKKTLKVAEIMDRLIELHKDASGKLRCIHSNDKKSALVLRTRRNAIQQCISEIKTMQYATSKPSDSTVSEAPGQMNNSGSTVK
jgi:hypothetical protein